MVVHVTTNLCKLFTELIKKLITLCYEAGADVAAISYVSNSLRISMAVIRQRRSHCSPFYTFSQNCVTCFSAFSHLSSLY